MSGQNNGSPKSDPLPTEARPNDNIMLVSYRSGDRLSFHSISRLNLDYPAASPLPSSTPPNRFFGGERSWRGCRKDISPTHPASGQNCRHMLPGLYNKWTEQHTSSYLPATSKVEGERSTGNKHSAEDNLQQLQNLSVTGTPASKVKVPPRESVTKGSVLSKKKSKKGDSVSSQGKN